MRFIDLLQISLGNLKRRKLRTFLTILGVFIGTAAVVTLVGLGRGMTVAQLSYIEQYGSLKSIEVTPKVDGVKKEQIKYLDDKLIDNIKKLNHVEAVSPLVQASAILKQGSYSTNVMIEGVNEDYFKYIKVKKGNLPSKNSRTLEFIYGNMVDQGFYNRKTNKNAVDPEDPTKSEVDLYNRPVFVIFDIENYVEEGQNVSAEGAPKIKAKKYIIPTAGLIEGEPGDYNQYSFNVFADIEALKTQLKKVYGKKRAIPNQPLNVKGKPFKDIKYNKLLVFVDELDNIKSVQKEIKNMGYTVYSNTEFIENVKKSSLILQTFLGGVGAISLFVASIGIANTMMMSIYERTKEIGIMKVLGCDMSKIRDMFLIESGCIGLIGGGLGLIVGLILSLISVVFHWSRSLIGVDSPLVYIDIKMCIVSLTFAILIGMISGLIPALRAMKLSPLSALRND